MDVELADLVEAMKEMIKAMISVDLAAIKADGAMQCWLESVDRLVKDAFGIPQPDSRPGDSPIHDPIVINHLKEAVLNIKR